MIHQRRRRAMALLCSITGAGLLAFGLSGAVHGQGPGAADEFYDSHFHLTNYIQQGLDPAQFLQIMGTRVGRSTLFGIPLQQQWSHAQLRRLCAHLLPAERRAALLLLVHRRLHRERLLVADAGGAGAFRPDDYRVQPGRHVRRRSHPPRAPDLPRCVLGHRRVHASTRSLCQRRSLARRRA